MFVIQVAVPVPLRQLFSYTFDRQLPPGSRVLVPFGARSVTGVVIDSDAALTPEPVDDNLKPIQAVLDTQPLIDSHLLELGRWLTDYFHHPIGDTYSTLLPAWLRAGKTQVELNALVAETIVSLTAEGLGAEELISASAHQQKKLLSALKKTDLTKSAAIELTSASTVKNLQNKGWLTESTRTPEARMSWQEQLILADKPVANRQQGAAIGTLVGQLSRFNISLLEGVTGSGKTEVYLQVIEDVLLQGRQALVLVPEIGLTPQTVGRFEQRFGCEVGVLHSKVTDRKRMQIWLRAKNGDLPLVIGTRSAVFTPFLDLGLIVVDEEHDDSFKQQDGLRYHARDVAAVRAQKLSIPLLLGSATPSLESLNNALQGRYQHLHLEARAGKAQVVSQYVQDMRSQPVQGGISEHLIEKMQQHLQAGNQVLVFLNRRGYAPAMLCHTCGYVEMCHRCDKPMTYHKQQNRLICHHCGAQRALAHQCRECGASTLSAEGMGTEQLTQNLATLFPNTAIARIDRDVISKKNALQATLDKINSGQVQLLIGTQIIAKGHHFPDVTLVVVVDVDAGLFSCDFRATEKLAQLVTQLAGRAGRAEKRGEMWLQTHNPGHPVIQDLINNGYQSVSRSLLAERKHGHQFPFVVQAVVRAEGHQQQKIYELLAQTRLQLDGIPDVAAIGPVKALIEKKQGRFRMLLILKTQNRRVMHQHLRTIVNYLSTSKEARQVRWAVDVDAIDLT